MSAATFDNLKQLVCWGSSGHREVKFSVVAGGNICVELYEDGQLIVCKAGPELGETVSAALSAANDDEAGAATLRDPWAGARAWLGGAS